MDARRPGGKVMAYAAIPPSGPLWETQKRREQRWREHNSADPVERYRLRENRIQSKLDTISTEIIKEKKQ
jgi:hypothetical protein